MLTITLDFLPGAKHLRYCSRQVCICWYSWWGCTATYTLHDTQEVQIKLFLWRKAVERFGIIGKENSLFRLCRNQLRSNHFDLAVCHVVWWCMRCDLAPPPLLHVAVCYGARLAVSTGCHAGNAASVPSISWL